MDSALGQARDIVIKSKRIVLLTGAGISTDSGVPDFRGPAGVWTKDPDAEKLSDIRYYRASTEIRKKAWIQRLMQWEQMRHPNPGHLAIAGFESSNRLLAVITQNVDGLHQDAGTSPERLIEVHGTIRQVRCLTCDQRTPMGKTLERVRAGEADPACKACGGILKSDTISFGQSLNPETIRRASDAVAECDCLLAVGTSLQVYPIAGLVPQAVKTGASLLIVNQQATPMDHLASVVLHESISEVLPFLLSPK
ncbi:MAG: NAD-dependent deacetylase [Betaproteobacteria bacterium]|nr:NAD-dependent deacetylase [Betaproteobacteria bacterium]HAB48758.1 NAD-dependent deacetylase [Lautropia sp.]NBP38516.1 NAD-dependent deacetylase [Betaproteobacteria bacterium]NCV13611.1 NAD-dependent deacetylase [Betaproteobacteria bacterium]NCW80637.1 NAD-dependent deacetylase [Betaproteobacteria bacterium]